jgi:hypothetical protein
MVRRIFVPLLLLLSLGCNNIDNPVDLGPAVRGIVTDAATNATIAEARVTVGLRSGQTNVNGAYYIPDLQKGTHTLNVEKAGYVTYTAQVTVEDSLGEKNVKLAKQ